MATVYLFQDANIVVTSTIVSGRLQLSINGVVLGTVDDCWDPSLLPPPPAVTRMTILNVPDGTMVSARWQRDQVFRELWKRPERIAVQPDGLAVYSLFIESMR